MTRIKITWQVTQRVGARTSLNLSVSSSYPEITVDLKGSYCDCELKEYQKTGVLYLGPRYCPKHNVITLCGIYEPKDLETIDETAVHLLNHETLHWLLCRCFDESVSMNLDHMPALPPFI